MPYVQPSLNKTEYITDIDGLRALAVAAVLAFHFMPLEFGGGFLGVDVFFVISGFVISRVLLSELRDGGFSFAAFFRRRFIRLFPALLVTLYVCAFAGAALLFSDEYLGLSRHIGAGLTFVSNFLSWSEAGYFDQEATGKPLLHLWSLGVEAQFYLLWPLIMVRLGGASGRYAWFLAAISIGSFGASLFIYRHYPDLEFYGPMTRIWEFAFGCAVAYVRYGAPATTQVQTTACRRTEYLWLFLMVGLISCFFLMNRVYGAEPSMRLFPVIATAALLSMSGRSLWSHYVLSNPVARWFGNISYPLYLWHWPILSFYMIVAGQRPSGPTSLALCLTAITAAWLTNRSIERPYQRWARSESGRTNGVRILVGLASVLLASMALSLLDDGWQNRGESYVRSVQQSEWRYKANPDCEARFDTPPPYCLAFDTQRPNGVAILGDSVSNALLPGVLNISHQTGIAAWNLGKPGCPPLAHIEKKVGSIETGCATPISNALSFIVSEKTISTVIISGAFAVYVSGHTFNAGWEENPGIRLISSTAQAGTEGLSNAEIFEQGLEETLVMLLAAEKRVIFVHPVPQLDFEPKNRCLDARPLPLFTTPPLPCAVSRADVKQHQVSYRAIVKDLLQKFPEVEEVDPSDLLCDSKLCYGMRFGRLLYRDNTHLSISGSELIASSFPDITNVSRKNLVR